MSGIGRASTCCLGLRLSKVVVIRLSRSETANTGDHLGGKGTSCQVAIV